MNQDKKRGIVTYSLFNLIELKSTQTQIDDVEFLIMKRIYIYIYIYLIRHFGVWYRCVFLRVVPYQIQTTSKNTQRHYKPKRLISYLLPNCFFFLLSHSAHFS